MFTYPGAGHFSTRPDGPDEAAAALTWERAADFVRLRQA
ncbi:dienelactone hydrolase family protein [Amycolatopsis sp. NBC_01488]